MPLFASTHIGSRTTAGIRRINSTALRQRKRESLWKLSFSDGYARHDQLKHKYPFFGQVCCRQNDKTFYMFHVNDDVVAWQYFWLDSFEVEVMNRFYDSLKTASRVLDIGAYTGCYSLLAAKSGAHVTAFEMIPRTVERLKINARLNQLENLIEILPYGVSSTAGSKEISMPRNADFLGTGNSVETKKNIAIQDSTTCNFLVIDEWWRNNSAPKVDLIKLDVEEHEHEALAGAMEMIASCKPEIVLEIASQNLEQVQNRLGGVGYKLLQLRGHNYFASAK